MNRQSASALAIVLVLSVPAAWGGDDAKQKAKKEAIEKELKLLEGAWDQISVVEEGKKIETPKGVRLRTTIRGGAYTVEGGDKIYAKGTLKLDPDKKPKALDVITTDGVVKGMVFLAIYELKGDELRMCVAQPGQDRPTEFSAGPGSERVVQTFRRAKPKE
jgi:uncharacterized protein (TIGR03067 family)